MQEQHRAHRTFVILWTLLTAVKLVIAARLPLFVDEAFYWQEGQHPALAYSDLPGLTAWLVRLGVEIGGNHPLALRLPFVAIAALLPWLVAHIASRWFGALVGWQAGCLMLLMPLAATLGVLAVPDVPLALAAVLCLDAGARLLREVEASTILELAVGLVLGALSHYRFAGVIGMGFLALLLIPRGRELLRDPRLWIALLVGALAWLPLLTWNWQHGEAGLRFQLLDRHPWRFQATAAWFPLIQIVLLTPLLAWAMLSVARGGLRAGSSRPHWRYFALLGGVSTLAIFVLGFFTDAERISFHWPLPGYLALLVAAPVVFGRWPRRWRRANWALLGLGAGLALGGYLAVSFPTLRAHAAGEKWYPRNFVGWSVLADAVHRELAAMPAGSRILADNFKVGAELGFLLGDADIEVLQAPLNAHHGRSAQLQLWRLLRAGEREEPRLLVLSPSDMRYRDLLRRYHDVCAMVGPLPPPELVSLDHGYQRFLLFRLPADKLPGQCVTPAMAWVDGPVPNARLGGRFEVHGWAFKDGIGLSRVEVLIDGRVAAEARYGRALEVRPYWRISTDPRHPYVGFSATLDAASLGPGRHWLGLRLHGRDGSVEDWWEQPLQLERR